MSSQKFQITRGLYLLQEGSFVVVGCDGGVGCAVRAAPNEGRREPPGRGRALGHGLLEEVQDVVFRGCQQWICCGGRWVSHRHINASTIVVKPQNERPLRRNTAVATRPTQKGGHTPDHGVTAVPPLTRVALRPKDSGRARTKEDHV